MMSTARALVRASHPEPGIAVTTLAVLLAISMDGSARTVVLLAVAAYTGQLSVGWSNDMIDIERDRVAERRDKPLATGVLHARTVRAAIAVALVLTVATSLAIGLLPGLLHLGLVATSWSYNMVLKRTLLSWLPYAVCFGMLPVVVSIAATGDASPGWMPVAGSLLGVGAHLINAVPDLEGDDRTGVRGLPQRLGARRSLDIATVLMLAGSIVTVVGPGDGVDARGIVTLVVVGALAVSGRVSRGPGAFRAAIAIALVDVVALLVRS